jgi:uncharacterized cupredoxin-like copper-binding protein
MRVTRRGAVFVAAGLALGFLSGAAFAGTVVTVELWDKGTSVAMPTGLVYGMPGVDKSKATLGIKMSRASAEAGDVTFEVTNTSKEMVHEMILLYLQDPTKPLPYLDKEFRVDEDKAGDKGEVSELDPGKSGTLTVALQPGKYLLICNVPGHYAAGQWTEFEVTK